MTRSSCRVSSLGRVSVFAFALFAVPASLARAQCVEDADCGQGMVCEELELPMADCPPGQTCPAPPDEPPSEGVCVGAPCTEDADCANGFGCDLGGAPQVSPTCPRDGDCPEPVPAPEPEGRCEAQPIECEVDADCPTGLTCVEEDRGDSAGACTATPDGNEECVEVSDPEPEPATRACGFALVECEQDGDCTQAGYACLTSEGVSSCSDAPCSADGECPDEPTCTSNEVQLCYPARVDCTSDSDCAEGWTCYTLPDDSAENAPEGYEGATDVCFPEGIVLAIEERIELADVDDGGDGGGRSASDSAEDGSDSKSVDQDSASSGDGESAASESGADNGCSVAAAPMHGARGTPLWLVFASAIALARRRRSRVA